MDILLHLIAAYGLWLVFAAVFLDQGGVPVPAYPVIVVTAAVAVDRGESTWGLLGVAVLAAILADWLWFLGGRKLGGRLVRLMCKLSLSPDSCVMRTRGIYAQWGASSLIVAKFVPGFAAVATTMAGQTGTRTSTFLLFDGIGALLWAASAIALGVIFHDAVGDVLAELERLGHFAVPMIAALVVAFVLWKWIRRRMFLRALRMARISPGELAMRLASGEAPLILDVREAMQRELTGWIPGALHLSTPEEALVPPHGEVIVYCDCPNELSAAVMARALMSRGFRNVRPLEGGFDAWFAQGHAIDGAP